MKKLKINFILLLSTVVFFSCGNSQDSNNEYSNSEFKVYGNCGMCEKTIEGALNNKDGIKTADWDKESKLISVTFNPKQISLDSIKSRIAKVGYDTDSHRAKLSVYSNLPECCKYDRPK